MKLGQFEICLFYIQISIDFKFSNRYFSYNNRFYNELFI